LQERLAYLQNRKNAIAGIVNLSGEEVGDRLAEIGRGAASSSPATLVKLLGIVRFIRESPNFQALEQRYASATDRLASGIGKLGSLLARRPSPPDEAAGILSEQWGSDAVTTLTDGDFVEQRQTVLDGIRRDQLRIMTFIMGEVSPPKRLGLQTRLSGAEKRVAEAATIAELREAMREYAILLTDIQDASREQANALLRAVYFLQDFFSVRS
jgi:hypothetical protein